MKRSREISRRAWIASNRLLSRFCRTPRSLRVDFAVAGLERKDVRRFSSILSIKQFDLLFPQDLRCRRRDAIEWRDARRAGRAGELRRCNAATAPLRRSLLTRAPHRRVQTSTDTWSETGKATRHAGASPRSRRAPAESRRRRAESSPYRRYGYRVARSRRHYERSRSAPRRHRPSPARAWPPASARRSVPTPDADVLDRWSRLLGRELCATAQRGLRDTKPRRSCQSRRFTLYATPSIS